MCPRLPRSRLAPSTVMALATRTQGATIMATAEVFDQARAEAFAGQMLGVLNGA